MSDIVWKAIKLGDIFERDNSHQISGSKKILDESPTYDSSHTIMNITASKNNNGCSGYLADVGEVARLKKKRFLTIASDAAYGGICFYQDGYFVSTGHSNLLTLKNNNLKNLLDVNILGYKFIAKLITVALCNGAANRFFRSISSDFDREIILLPCLEVTKNDDYILEENGHFYTLAIEYIEHLMNEAKELREQKTIRLYEAERAKYERERAKYEEGYKKERDVLVWKGFKLGDLYSFDSSNQYPFTQKQIDISDKKDDIHTIAVIAQSALNNGVIGYIENSESIKKYISHDNMTFSLNFGICFYHSYDYVLLDTHGSIFRLNPNNQRYDETLKGNLQCNLFIAKLINKVCAKSLYNWQWKPNSSRASREIILLPCLEVTKNDDYILEENGHFYTLAIEYISYIYLSGRVEFNQRLIDKYEYKY